jgi:hypothetical protein
LNVERGGGTRRRGEVAKLTDMLKIKSRVNRNGIVGTPKATAAKSGSGEEPKARSKWRSVRGER